MRPPCFLILFTTLLTALVPPAALAAPRYTITDLGPVGSAKSRPTAINSRGDIVGQASGVDCFLIKDGTLTDISAQVKSGLPADINVSGAIIGAASFTEENGIRVDRRAFVLSGGVFTWLGVLPGDGDSFAYAINASGQIVGISFANAPAGFLPHAFLYENGSMVALLPEVRDVTPSDINDRGQIVGTTKVDTIGHGKERAFLYDHGKLRYLPTLPGYGFGTEADRINARGDIVGSAYGPGYKSARAVLWSKGRIHRIDPPEAWSHTAAKDFTFGYDLNNRGQVVGNAPHNRGAFLYENGKAIDLQETLPTGSGWQIRSVRGINDASLIICSATNSTGETHAILLTPALAVTIAGPKEMTTHRHTRTIHGESAGTVSRVLYRVGKKGPYRLATGTISWRFVATLRHGDNLIMVRAVSDSPRESRRAKITVVRS